MSRIRPVTVRLAPIDKFQSTLRTVPDLCKNVALAVLFGGNGNSYTICTKSRMCICTHILHNIKNWDSSECRTPFWAREP
jgi:hypothetical protein